MSSLWQVLLFTAVLNLVHFVTDCTWYKISWISSNCRMVYLARNYWQTMQNEQVNYLDITHALFFNHASRFFLGSIYCKRWVSICGIFFRYFSIIRCFIITLIIFPDLSRDTIDASYFLTTPCLKNSLCRKFVSTNVNCEDFKNILTNQQTKLFKYICLETYCVNNLQNYDA